MSWPRYRIGSKVGTGGLSAVVLLILGLVAFATSSTAIVLAKSSSSVYAHGGSSQPGPGAGAIVLTTLIWIVIGVINVAYVIGTSGARRNPG